MLHWNFYFNTGNNADPKDFQVSFGLIHSSSCDGSRPLEWADEKITPAHRTNQISGFADFLLSLLTLVWWIIISSN